MKICLLKESRVPDDRRVAFSPQQLAELKKQFPNHTFTVQASENRCFSDASYEAEGIKIVDQASDFDILIGVKEVSSDHLFPGKSYFFFSHTIKQQKHNQAMLQEILYKNISLYDYELLTNEKGKRILGFGKWAGIVGAWYAVRMYFEKYKDQDLPSAMEFESYQSLIDYYKELDIMDFKALIAGSGNVGDGALEFLSNHPEMAILTPSEYIKENKKGICQLGSEELFINKYSGRFDKKDFYKNPAEFKNICQKYFHGTHVLINAIFWKEGIARHFELNELPDHVPSLIADISCDKNGSIPLTTEYTTSKNPYLYFDKKGHKLDQDNAHFSIMAVTNLPNELAKSASEDFGDSFKSILSDFLNNPNSEMLNRALICTNGKLNKYYDFLAEYAELSH